MKSFRAAVMVYTGATADICSYENEVGKFRADFSKQTARDSSGSAENPVGEVSSSLRAFPFGMLIMFLGLTGGMSSNSFISVRHAVAVTLVLVALTVVGVTLPTEAIGGWKVDVSENLNFPH